MHNAHDIIINNKKGALRTVGVSMVEGTLLVGQDILNGGCIAFKKLFLFINLSCAIIILSTYPKLKINKTRFLAELYEIWWILCSFISGVIYKGSSEYYYSYSREEIQYKYLYRY